ncbi:MAG: 4-amino-4-deoxy-L-arabinose transferase-like protein glycosyltransferase of PMT family, partial [Candidatus Woesebacteria bacterium GW2011_GWA1_39_11b]
MFRKYFPAISLLLISFLLLFCFYRLTQIPYLTFSDGAKFADIGRNLASGLGYGANFVRFGSDLEMNSKGLFSAPFIPPLTPFFNAVSFKLFGVSDLSVIATSSFFYILLVFTTYLLGKRLWGNLVGLLAAIAVAFNPNFLDYAVSGASETLFAFEIVLAAYLFILGKKRANVFGFLVLILMYLTRPQAIIYLFGFLLLFFLLNFPIKKALSYFSVAFVLGSAIYLLFSKQGLFAVTQHLPGVASSDALRGGTLEAGILPISKKVFYNLYNFYRLLPQIMSPYLWALFIIGLFKLGKDRVENSFKIATIFMVAVTFLAAALTIPFFRYL